MYKRRVYAWNRATGVVEPRPAPYGTVVVNVSTQIWEKDCACVPDTVRWDADGVTPPFCTTCYTPWRLTGMCE